MSNWIATIVDHSGHNHLTVGADFGWSPFKAIKKAVHSVSSGVLKVPVLGGALHATYDATLSGPLQLANGIAHGQRIDKAALGSLKSSLKGVKEVAPYVQTAITFVPGVGQGISGAIGAASALAQGKSITNAMLAAAKGAIPGGPIAQSAFEIASAGMQGKPISEIALASLPMSDDQKKMLVASVKAARDIAHGKNIAHELVDQGKNLLPPEAQKALQTGLALAHAKNLQELAAAGAAQAIDTVKQSGNIKLLTDKVMKSGLDQLKTVDQKTGFTTGVGLAQHLASPQEVNAIRGRLSPDAKRGFDLAMAAHIGATKNPLPNTISPEGQFGYYAQLGMQTAKPKNQSDMKAVLVSNPKMTQGMLAARRNFKMGFWAKVKQWVSSHRQHPRS